MLYSFIYLALLSSVAFAHQPEPRAHESRAPVHASFGSGSEPLRRRTITSQSIAFACYGGGGDCECPTDLNGDSGVLINVFPGYQCAYAGGACTWDDKVRHCSDCRIGLS